MHTCSCVYTYVNVASVCTDYARCCSSQTAPALSSALSVNAHRSCVHYTCTSTQYTSLVLIKPSLLNTAMNQLEFPPCLTVFSSTHVRRVCTCLPLATSTIVHVSRSCSCNTTLPLASAFLRAHLCVSAADACPTCPTCSLCKLASSIHSTYLQCTIYTVHT
jgi:hypothetical protein